MNPQMEKVFSNENLLNIIFTYLSINDIINFTSSNKKIKENNDINNICNLKLTLDEQNYIQLCRKANSFINEKYEIEKEIELSQNEYGNKNELIIKDLKKDIQIFKNKNKKKKKIIKEFQKFCKEFYFKYQKYMNSITNNKEL